MLVQARKRSFSRLRKSVTKFGLNSAMACQAYPAITCEEHLSTKGNAESIFTPRKALGAFLPYGT